MNLLLRFNLITLLVKNGPNFQDKDRTKINLGANVDLGMDYYRSSFLKAFFSVGYLSSRGFDQCDNKQRIQNINVNLGIYF